MPPRVVPPRWSTDAFGRTREGVAATRVTLDDGAGMRAVLTDRGATLVALEVANARGRYVDVVLGFDDVAGYEGPDNRHFGCTVGRFANRIAGARLRIGDEVYALAANEGTNHIHGGPGGFASRSFAAEPFADANRAGVRFHRISPHLEEGYPGELDVAVTYSLTGSRELRIDYEARTSAPTVCNLTNHSYFNLTGHGAPGVLDHELEVAAARFTPADAAMIPTGEIATVVGTPLDLRAPRALRGVLDALAESPTHGLDHNFALDAGGDGLAFAARLTDPETGRAMEVWTTEPGLQVYTANNLSGQPGKGGARYAACSAICLETQRFPDAPNHPNFPSASLEPGETYRQATAYRFSSD